MGFLGISNEHAARLANSEAGSQKLPDSSPKGSCSPTRFVPQSELIMDSRSAEDHLRVIRELMESATIDRTISAPAALFLRFAGSGRSVRRSDTRTAAADFA